MQKFKDLPSDRSGWALLRADWFPRSCLWRGPACCPEWGDLAGSQQDGHLVFLGRETLNTYLPICSPK